jgi:hypothetical protein
MNPHVSAYLIMDEATLSEASAAAAHKAGGEWVVVNKRNGRQLVSCLAPAEMVPALLQMLAPHHPILVGTWDSDGVCADLDPAQLAAYVEVMPDDCTSTGADTLPIHARPTAPRDVCLWAGWAERLFA